MQQIQEGDRLRHKTTGEVVTVTAYSPGCGNVYVGERQTEISPSQFEPVPPDAPTQQPPGTPITITDPTPSEPTPVAVNGHVNGNGHRPTHGIPALRTLKGRVREKIGV